MKAKTKLIGDIGVLAVIKRCLENRLDVSIPFGDNCSYDLIIDCKNKLYRVQVKTTEKVKDNAVMVFATNKTNPYKSTKEKYTKNEIDKIFLYCIENDYMGVIDVEECKSQLTLRLKDTLNNQVNNIKFADDYSFENFLKKI